MACAVSGIAWTSAWSKTMAVITTASLVAHCQWAQSWLFRAGQAGGGGADPQFRASREGLQRCVPGDDGVEADHQTDRAPPSALGLGHDAQGLDGDPRVADLDHV